MAKPAPLSVRLPSQLHQRMAALAEAMDRPKSWIVERAVEDYVALQEWQVADIKQALKEADAGDFATEREVAATFGRLRRAGSLAAKRAAKSR
jgi:RHH-type rel operon transcriptional repressor/antitoxin RelB